LAESVRAVDEPTVLKVGINPISPTCGREALQGVHREEKRAWHEAKREREKRPECAWRPNPVIEFVRCGRSFGYGEGYISGEISLCDACDGD
jgi:hypothetical protein